MSAERLGGAPPTSVEEALAQARDHGRAALAESIECATALLDAATLATAGQRAGETGMAPATQTLEQLRRWLDPRDGRNPAALLDALFEALDSEVSRWEERSRDDPDARAVLRTFLAVRELLWEIGVRVPARGEAPSSPGGEPETASPRRRRAARAGARRVQRVPVEG